jgi:hypothetical protein
VIPCLSRPPVVVTLAVVEMARVRLCGPLLMLEIVDPVGSGKAQADPAGAPAPHEIATDSGKPELVGVTRIEYFTESPEAIVVGVVEVALTEKSFTVAVPPIVGVVPPGKLRLAVLPTEPVPCRTVVGAFTVTVTFAAKFTLCVAPHVFAVAKVVRVELFTVPKLQISSPLVTAFPQVPWLVLALVDPELMPSLSVNTTPETGSPWL